MRKPKIVCFRYKSYIDFYVSNVLFSTDKLISILDIITNKKIIVLIELDAHYIQTLSTICKNIGITDVIHNTNVPRFIMTCNKDDLLCLLNQAKIDNFEELFIASIQNNIISNEFIYSLEYTASSIVKKRISDISISINFTENQVVISLLKEKYETLPLKDKIRSIFGD